MGLTTQTGNHFRDALGRYRLIVERTLASLARFRRLAVRYECHADTSAVPTST
ncbi:hypothetical protein SAMN02799622_03972 [Methylobacterium sp. UNC378MF]|nr:hypothetical protein SAMN02799622_03972 [Methylobacterium sp. UNC378MF]